MSFHEDERIDRRGPSRLLAAVALLACAATSAAMEVRTESGRVSGTPIENSDVTVFKGIPYAAPPVGELRWQAPRRPARWKGVRKADEFGARCMQSDRLGDIDPLNPKMSEDCLYLNVWTPRRTGKQRLPVMVWIHGGGHTAGAGSEPWYSGKNLARRGVVAVTINYRLDVFGFLAHPELRTRQCDASGNYGLLDTIAALQWIKRNIAAFGGDPDAVTIFGESAGSVSISSLMASPLAGGLFERAIAQSGSAMMPVSSPYALQWLSEAEQDGVAFAKEMGAPSIAQLRQIPADELLEASLRSSATFGRFGVIKGDCVLPEDPRIVYEQGRQVDVPLIAGWTADEGTLFNLQRRFAKDAPDFRDEMRAKFGDRADAVLQLYPANTPEQGQESSDALLGDELVAYPMWRWIELHAQTGKAPVYRYLFDLRPPAPEVSRTPLAAPGVFHSADIPYVLDNFEHRDWPWREEDRRLARIASSYWINFARGGDPNGPSLPDWPVYRAGGNGQVMYLAQETQAGPERHRERHELLREFYESGQPANVE